MSISFPKCHVFCSLIIAFRLESFIFSTMILNPQIFQILNPGIFFNLREEVVILASSFSSFLPTNGPSQAVNL